MSKKKRYDTVLFDFDGCIANTIPAWFESFKNTFPKFGKDLSDEEVLKNSVQNYNSEKHFDDDKELTDFFETVYENFEILSKDTLLHKGFIENIKKIRSKNIKTALVTSTRRSVIDKKIIDLGIEDFFDTTVAWEDTEKNKPAPDPLLLAMKRLSSKAEETIMIGDTYADILAANASGATSIWYYPKVNELFYPDRMFEVHNPDFVIKHFDELKKILDLK